MNAKTLISVNYQRQLLHNKKLFLFKSMNIDAVFCLFSFKSCFFIFTYFPVYFRDKYKQNLRSISIKHKHRELITIFYQKTDVQTRKGAH